jgi:NodT family efflux transporter outer membrane factor (OMF) lipoprotein
MTNQSIKVATDVFVRRIASGGADSREKGGHHSGNPGFEDRRDHERRFFNDLLLGANWIWIILCFLLGTVGCKVGPNVRPYHDQLISSWHAHHDERFGEQNQAADQWWLNFDDPAMHQLIYQVANENLPLQEAAERIQEARARVGITRSGMFPSVAHQSSFNRIDISDNGNPAGISGLPFPPFDLWSTGFNVNWEIDLFGRVKRLTEAACADLQATAEARRALQVSLLGDVAASYVGMRVIEARIEQAKANIAIQEETLAITRRRFEAGEISDLDVAQAETQLYATRASVPNLERERELIINRLSILRGEQPQGLRDIAEASNSIPKVPDSIAIGIPHDLVRRRPDVRAVEQQVIAAGARIGVAEAELYPSISLTGIFTLDSKNASSLFESDSFGMRVGPAVRWNVFSFGRVLRGIEAAESAYRQAQLRYRQSVLDAVGEVEDALVTYHRNREIADQLEQAVASAKRGVDNAKRQYSSGAIPFQAVLDSQRQLTLITDEAIAARGNIVVSVVRLYKALGGGWNRPASPETVFLAEEPILVNDLETTAEVND